MHAINAVNVYLSVDQIYHLASPASPPNYMYNPIKVTIENEIILILLYMLVWNA